MGIGKENTAQVIDLGLPDPLYRQVSDYLRGKILSGQWPSKLRLPSEPDLAKECGVSRGTLRKAIEQLRAEKLLVQVRGRGTFVTEQAIDSAMTTTLSSIFEELTRRGIDFSTRVLTQEECRADESIAARLGLPPGEKLVHLERLRFDAIGPIAFIRNYVTLSAAERAELLATNLERESLFAEIERIQEHPIAYGERSITAVAAGGEEARALGIAPGSPMLYMEQVSFAADQQAIECSSIWINPARMRIHAKAAR
ncbi:GntR family transcriptional regulator [Corynebacterium sp. H128]|uniref:GntR family transcriptional regulator n=1 Tax=unclassified Corynebacterium TaxID=2624378 RepID=UPI0030B4DFA1